MSTSSSTTDLRKVLRGYDIDDVDRLVADLTERAERAEGDLQEQNRLVRRLSRELAESQERANRVKPNFTELGVAFEDTLRLAEQQASTMVATARDEAEAILAQAQAEAADLREKAATEAEEMLGDAKRTSERLRFDTDAELAQVRQQSADDSVKAKATLERAERQAEQLVSQAERTAAEKVAEAERMASEKISSAERAAEQIEKNAAQILLEAQQSAAEIEANARESLAEAERSRTAIMADADAYAQRSFSDAESTVAAASERAAVLNSEATIVVERARERARYEIEYGRSYSERLISDALVRATALTKDADETLRTMMADNELHIADLRRQITSLDEFSQRMRIFATESNRAEAQAREATRRLRDRENELAAAPERLMVVDERVSDAAADAMNDLGLAATDEASEDKA